jgi:DNA replication protein DnaC
MQLSDIEVPKVHAEPLELARGLLQTPALIAARAWRRSESPLVVLAGTVGTGKSLAAAWALWDWWCSTTSTNNVTGYQWRHKGRCWIAAPHLARLQRWHKDVVALESAPMLVLDDLGVEASTDSSADILQSLVTTRFADQLPTVITTNLDGQTFRQRYGERIVDRVRQCGLDENGNSRWWIRCAGESLRGVHEPQQRALPGDTDLGVVQ